MSISLSDLEHGMKNKKFTLTYLETFQFHESFYLGFLVNSVVQSDRVLFRHYHNVINSFQDFSMIERVLKLSLTSQTGLLIEIKFPMGT